jgi:hypothetical protein
MLIGKRISQGATLPFWYGVSYSEIDRFGMVCHPIPLNWLIGGATKLWWRLRRGFQPATWEKMLHETYREGVRDGAKEEAARTMSRICTHVGEKDAWFKEAEAWLKKEELRMDKKYKRMRKQLAMKISEAARARR